MEGMSKRMEGMSKRMEDSEKCLLLTCLVILFDTNQNLPKFSKNYGFWFLSRRHELETMRYIIVEG